MKLSLITTTFRPNPRLDAMARTLAASLRIAPPGTELEWQILDQVLVQATSFEQTYARRQAVIPFFAELPVAVSQRAIPDATHLTPAKLRNAALAYATGDYVVFLDDCTVVTKNFIGTAAACAAEGRGWRCKTKSLHDLPIPEDGKLRHGDHHDRLRIIPHTTVGGACWGAPLPALRKIGGFDPAYDGELRHNQLEAILRLSRSGVTFVTTGRAVAITLRRTHVDLAAPREAHVGARNAALYSALLADRGRTAPADARATPAGGGDFGIGEDDTPVADLPDDLAPPSAVAGGGEAVPLPGLPPESDETVPVAVPGSADVQSSAPRPVAPRKHDRPRKRRAGEVARGDVLDTRPAQARVVGYIGPAVAGTAAEKPVEVTEDELAKFAAGASLADEFDDGALDALDDDLGGLG